MQTNRIKSAIQLASAKCEGFTLTDLLVVLGVIAFLIVLEAPVLAGNKSQTKMGVCAGNLRQLVLATQIYANENNNRLPDGGAFAWAFSLPASSVNGLLMGGAKTNNFYCPGTAPRFTDQDNWIASGSYSLWNYGAPSAHIIGYAQTFSGNGNTINPTNQNSTMLPETLKGQTCMPAPPASGRVLIADATISGSYTDHQGPQVATYNFTQIAGGFYKKHLTPHLKGNIPAGGNVSFKDGHVAWRKFEMMDERASSYIGFWW